MHKHKIHRVIKKAQAINCLDLDLFCNKNCNLEHNEITTIHVMTHSTIW